MRWFREGHEQELTQEQEQWMERFLKTLNPKQREFVLRYPDGIALRVRRYG